MSNIYVNPFQWGKPVSGNNYISRPQAEDHIFTALEKQLYLIVIGQRGTGKTSLLKHVLGKSSIASSYLDLSFVVSRQDLFNLLVNTLEKHFPEAKEDGRSRSLKNEEQDSDFAAVFNLFYDLVKKSGQKFTLVWDEFQHLVRLKGNIIEELKENLRDRRGISHIFISHREDIMRDLFDDHLNPFFYHRELLFINNIDNASFSRFLTQRFRRMGLSDFDLADGVLNFTGSQPQLTQQFAHTLAQLWLEGTTTSLLKRTVTRMLAGQNTIFTCMWDNYGLNEKRLLLGLASGYSHPTELEFIKKFKLSATSTAHNTVLKLLQDGWIVHRDDGYYIYNPLFHKWLQKNRDRF